MNEEHLSILVNGRFTAQRLTGVQRYAWEVVNALRDAQPITLLRPPSMVRGRTGLDLVWEQFVLPVRSWSGSLLWSPTGSGPLFGPPHVVTLHDGAVLSHPQWFKREYAKWRRFFIPYLVERADAVITVSSFAKSHLLRHLDVEASKITPIHNGCNHERFRPAAEEEIKKVRMKFDLPPVYVLALASLEPRKNFRRLLQAWDMIEKETDVGASLVIGGGRPKHLQNIGADVRSDRVKIIGYVEDDLLPALYSAARVFVYPSVFEGFGLPVLEAMACETPVVTSNRTSLPEVAGDAAHLVDPYHVESIAEGITQVLEDSSYRDDLRRRGRERAKSFTWARTATETLNVLERVQSA